MSDTYIDTFDPNYKPPTGGYVDTFDPNYQPPKPVGVGGAFKQGFKTTIGEAAQAAGDIAGAQGVRKWGAELRSENAPVGEESIPVSVARGVGGLAAWLPAIAGTAAVLPEAAGAGAVGVGLNLARGAASMALPAISSKVNTTSDMNEKGVDGLTASNAGWAAAATTAAMGAVPVGLAGGLLKRATTGALSGLVTGEAGRMAQNSVLSEHPELQQDFSGKQAVVESVIGAVLGGVMGHRSPVKKELDDVRSDIEQQLNPQPVLALPNIPEPMIGYPGGEVARKGQMEAYINSLPEGERAPARARLMGMGSIEQQLNPQPVLALPNIPEPMIGYPGGEVARKGQMEAYINSLPEGERAPARARLMGMGSIEAGPETTIPPEPTVHGEKFAALSAESARQTDALIQANKEKAGFGQVQEFADFAAQEKADLAQRRDVIAQWRASKLASDIESTDNRVETARLRQRSTDRQNLMDSIYADPKERTPGMTFLAALEREYPNRPDPTPQEKAMIAKRDSVYRAFNSKEVIPATPNELVLPEKGGKTTPTQLAGVAGDRARGVKDVTNMWAAVLKESDGAISNIKAQHIAKAVKGKETITEQLAGIDALRKKPGAGTDNKALLDQLAAKLSKYRKEKPANEQTEIQTQAAETKPGEAEPKTETPVTEVSHAIPVQGATEVPILPEARAGEGVRGGNAEHEKIAGTEGNGPAAKQEEITNPLLRAAAGLKPVKPEVKVESNLPPREAGREAPFGENTQERSAARESDMASREQAIRDRFAKGELTHPEATRMLGDLVAEGEEYRAWASIEHDNSEPQMSERADGLGDKDAVDTQAALKNAKTVGEALTAVRENVSPKWQKFIDGLLAVPDAMSGKFSLSGISKTNITTNMARLGEHSQGDVTLHNGAGVSTLLHEAVHARTAWGIDHDPVFRNEVQAVFDAAKKSGNFQTDSYMFTNLHEFIAEASTRPEIQAALDALPSPKGKTLFGRVLDAIRKLLGLQPGQKSMLDDVLKMVEMAPAPKYPQRTSVLDMQYSERGRSMDFARGPVAANKAVQSVLSKAMDNISKLKPSFNTQYLKWSQLTHIADMTGNLFDLAKHDEAGNRIARWGMGAVNPIRDKVDNMMKSAAMAKTFNHTTKKLYDGIQGLTDKQRSSLYDLMGQYQLAKVFPNLKWEDHVWLTEADKDTYRRAKQLYAQPGVGRMYDEIAAHNKTLHDAGMASLIKSMGQIYGAPEHLWRAVDPAKGMGKEVKAVTDWSVTEKPTTKDQFDQALALHEAKKQEAYFSIGRDGDYMVNFHVKDTPEAHAAVQAALKRAGVDKQIVVKPGDTHVFSMFDTANEMLTVAKQLDTLNAAGHLEKPYNAGKTVDKLRELDSSAPSFIRGMLAKIDDDPNLAGADPEMVAQRDAQKELLRRMYINMLPESSVSKFYARRSGTPGYSSDMARSFVKRAAAGAYFVSNHATRAEQTIAMARIREAVRDFGDSGSEFFNLDKQQKAVAVLNELNQRTANNLNPINTPTQDVLGAIGHTFYLSASPSFIIQNLAQPYQITLPYLGGRHGFVASGTALAAAAKDVVPMLKDAIQQGYKDGKWTGVLDAAILVDRAKIPDADKRALKALIASGRADWTQGGELSHIQEGQNPRLQNAVRSANLASYYGESLNRMQTALATFRLEMKRNGNNEAAAHERMISAVDDTQINYASENRARAIGKHGIFGSVTPLLFAFQQFNLGVMQTLSKLVMQAHGAEKGSPERAEAVKSLAGMLATTGVMAGTMGLPLVGAITGAYNALAGDENHPPDAATDYQNFLSDIVGPDGARVIAHGAINYVTGVDAASRLGQENLMPFTQLFSRFADSRMQLKDRLDSGALEFMGPMIGMPVNVAKGFGEMADGDLMKGAIQMAPSAIKGGLKASDLAEKGFTDSHGNKWGDATSWDVAVQAMNFTPETKATRNEAQQGVSAITGALHNRVSELENNFIKAYEAKDAEGRAQALDDIREFRMAHPDQQINIGAALRKRAKDQAVEKMTGGVSGRIKQTPFIKEQTRYTQ